ncbi:MAG: trigger factor [Oscillospiraceae bacterium]|nr:trigger factor [Oscillospiraceae bacterium]
MNIKSCEQKEKSQYQIIVEISPEEFESAVGKAFLKNKKSISVPGFRRGKAPRKIVERMYGATVFHSEALDMLLPDVLEFADKETTVRTVGYPQISDVDIKEGENSVDITVMTAIYPEVKLGEYKGLSAVKPDAEIPESAVDAEIAAARMRGARIEKADRPAVEGDVTVIDYDGYLDGERFEGGKAEGYELELGSKAFIPGFEDKLIGMVPGEERDIDLVFPENYTEHLAGKPVVFKIKLHEIKEKLLPELDDEFAKDVSEFDTLDEYKADIRERLKTARQADADAAFENALLEKVVENLEVDIPDAMIEEQMDMAINNFSQQIQAYGMKPESYLQMMNLTPETFRENIRSNAEKQVRVNLALEKIAEIEAFEVTAEEIEKEYQEASERFGMEIDEIKKNVDEEKVIAEIKTRHAARVITENATAEAPPPEGEADSGEGKAKKPASKSKASSTKKTTAKKADDTDDDAAEAPKEKAKKAPTKKAAASVDDIAAEAPKEKTKKSPAKKTVAGDEAAAEEPKSKPKKAPAKKKAEDAK